MGQQTTNHVAWGQYARQQHATRRMECHATSATHGEAALDLILSRIEQGRPVDEDEVSRCRRSADRRERARTAVVLRFARTVEGDMRHRGPADPETAAAIAAALAMETGRDATILAMDAQGYASHEIAAATGMGAAAVRQRLSRRSKAILAA